MKVRSLREIETIRETKKREMIDQMLGQEADNICPVINVVPGQLTFTPPLQVYNDTNTNQMYTVKIFDPDEEILGG